MKRLELYRSGRQPRAWTEHLRESEWAVFLSDVRTGAELNPDGTPLRAGELPGCWVFDDLGSAEAFCQQRVEAIETMQCEVYDRRGKALPPRLVVMSPRAARRRPSRRSAGRLILIAIALVSVTPLLFWLDWRSGGAWILPSLIGVTLIGIAARLVMWALGLYDAARLAERSQPKPTNERSAE